MKKNNITIIIALSTGLQEILQNKYIYHYIASNFIL
jgi:hypothetical protein